MSRERFDRRPAVVLVGGLTDTEESLRELGEPLTADYRIFPLPGRWNDKRESAKTKITRIQNELAEIAKGNGRIATVVGISAGGPLALTTGHNLEHVNGIVAASSPLRWPERLPLKLKAVLHMYPALDDLLGHFSEEVLPNITSMKNSLMTFRGTRDRKVPPELSTIDGTRDEQIPTPRGAVLTSHSYNIRTALRLPALREFISQPRSA